MDRPKVYSEQPRVENNFSQYKYVVAISIPRDVVPGGPDLDGQARTRTSTQERFMQRLTRRATPLKHPRRDETRRSGFAWWSLAVGL